MSPRKLIVVSNRGPVTYDDDGTAARGAGGLVTALAGLLSRHEVTWIASALSDGDKAAGPDPPGAPCRLRFVVHEDDAYDRYYNVVANPVLWFVQHQLWNLPYTPSHDRGLEAAWEDGYAEVNRAFAEAVVDELDSQPDAAVFFQDYHLYLAPRLVREQRPDALLGHFVHIPWPGPDAWGVLPRRISAAVHDGLLANDVVSFHSHRWSRNFLRSAEDILEAPVEGVLVTAHPISVDVEEFEELKESAAVRAAEASIEAARPERLIVRVDRTDPSKNIVRGFRAFELLLEEHPELHGRVGMLALLNPSRGDVPEYAEYVAAVQRCVRELNERFRADEWVPVELHIHDDFAAAVAGYKQFDVLLVNPVYDGLNLVAKEAPLVNERDGAVVLSENAGAYEELADWVIGVNPFDVAEQAEALYEALELPLPERRRRLDAIRAHVREHDVAAWADAQLADLDRVAAAARR